MKREDDIWCENGLMEKLEKVRDLRLQSDTDELKAEQKAIEQRLGNLVNDQGKFRCLPWPENDWRYAHELWKCTEKKMK